MKTKLQSAELPIPNFQSDAAAADYFDTHSVADVWDQLPEGGRVEPSAALEESIRERHIRHVSAGVRTRHAESVRHVSVSRDEFHRMEESGILEGRYELIEGDPIEKIGQNPPHANALRLMCAWLAACFGMGRISVQLPVVVAPADQERNLPEPDIAVLNALLPDYSQRHPRGDELTLIVEIADSSSRFDLVTKAGLYARAGVPEYWVLDVVRRLLVVHRSPEDGGYRRVEQFAGQETVEIGGKTLSISSVLG